MVKISGLDRLTGQLGDAQKALENIAGELGTVSFDPNDPASVEAAIQSVEALINGRLGQYASNSIVARLAENMKEQYRESIIDRAAAARLENGSE